MLLQIPALLSVTEAARCRALLEQQDWQDGRLTAGHIAQYVKTNQQLPRDNVAAQQVGQLILEKLAQNPLFMSVALPLKVLPPLFNRYEGGTTYGDHIDNAIFTMPHTGDKVRSDVSTTVFLSDADAYEGGELVISDTYGEQRVKLNAGDAIVYPATSLHRVEPVTAGTRIGAFFWTQSLVASNEQRQILYDLDVAIQQVLQVDAKSEAGRRLSGVYHNLLRQWSHT